MKMFVLLLWALPPVLALAFYGGLLIGTLIIGGVSCGKF